MTFAERLRRRARAYGKMAMAGLMAALMGVVLLAAFWVPPADHNTAFSTIEANAHMQWWVHAHVAYVFNHQAPAAITQIFSFLAFVGGVIGFLVLLAFRRPWLAVGVLLVGCLAFEVNVGVMDRYGFDCFLPGELRPDGLAALQRAASDPGAVRAEIGRPGTIYSTSTGIIVADSHDFTADSVASDAHFMLAQRAYLAGDTEEARRQLLVVRPDALQMLPLEAYRYNAIRRWLKARGHRMPGLGLDMSAANPPLTVRRPLTLLGYLLACGGVWAAGGLYALIVILRRRAARLDGYVQALKAA